MLEEQPPATTTTTYAMSGAGKNVGDDPQLRKCKNQTLDVQWCLAKNNHQQSRCEATIDLWRQCYERARETVPESETTAAEARA